MKLLNFVVFNETNITNDSFCRSCDVCPGFQSRGWGAGGRSLVCTLCHMHALISKENRSFRKFDSISTVHLSIFVQKYYPFQRTTGTSLLKPFVRRFTDCRNLGLFLNLCILISYQNTSVLQPLV